MKEKTDLPEGVCLFWYMEYNGGLAERRPACPKFSSFFS